MCNVVFCHPISDYPPHILARIINRLLEADGCAGSITFWEINSSVESLTQTCNVIKKLQSERGNRQFYIQVMMTGEALQEKEAHLLGQLGAVVGLLSQGLRSKKSHTTCTDLEQAYGQITGAANLLDRMAVPFYVVESVTPISAPQITEAYQFFGAHGWRFQSYRPNYKLWKSAVTKKAEIYLAFLLNLFQLWWEDRMRGNTVYIWEFDRLAGLFKGVPSIDRDEAGRRKSKNLITQDGTVYPSKEAMLSGDTLGNVMEMDFPMMEEQYLARKRDFCGDPTISDNCRGCRWAMLCGGNWDGWHGERNTVCSAYCRFYEFAVPRLMDLLREIGKNFPIPGTMLFE